MKYSKNGTKQLPSASSKSKLDKKIWRILLNVAINPLKVFSNESGINIMILNYLSMMKQIEEYVNIATRSI